jgi:hypothetical protein
MAEASLMEFGTNSRVTYMHTVHRPIHFHNPEASGGWKRSRLSKPYGLPIFLMVQESIHRHHNNLVLPHFADCCIACWLAVQFLIVVASEVPLIHFITQFLSCGCNADCSVTHKVFFSISDSKFWFLTRYLSAIHHIFWSPSRIPAHLIDRKFCVHFYLNISRVHFYCLAHIFSRALFSQLYT